MSAAGRALLAMPDGTQIQELSLTVLAVVGYLLLCRRTVRPLLCGAGQLALELILCGSQTGGAWAWLLPLLRAADLWLLWLSAFWMLRQTGLQRDPAVVRGADAPRLQRRAGQAVKDRAARDFFRPARL